MSTGSIYKETMRYSIIRAAIGFGVVVLSTVLFMILNAIFSAIAGENAGKVIAVILCILITGGIIFLEERKFGFKNELGYIVMLLIAHVEGSIPIDLDNLARRMMKNRFRSENRFFLMKRLVQDALIDLERVRSEKKIFVNYLYLKYMLSSCIAYTFCDDQKNIFHGALDGVLIYGENENSFDRKDKKTLGMIIGGTIAFLFVPAVLLAILYHFIGMTAVLGAVLGVVLGYFLKVAVIDHYFMISELEQFIEVAGETAIYEDLYLAYMEESTMCKRLVSKARILL